MEHADYGAVLVDLIVEATGWVEFRHAFARIVVEFQCRSASCVSHLGILSELERNETHIFTSALGRLDGHEDHTFFVGLSVYRGAGHQSLGIDKQRRGPVDGPARATGSTASDTTLQRIRGRDVGVRIDDGDLVGSNSSSVLPKDCRRRWGLVASHCQVACNHVQAGSCVLVDIGDFRLAANAGLATDENAEDRAQNRYGNEHGNHYLNERHTRLGSRSIALDD